MHKMLQQYIFAQGIKNGCSIYFSFNFFSSEYQLTS